MVDFQNKSIIKLKEIDVKDGLEVIEDIMIDSEYVMLAFSSMRDKLIFTNKRIISVNVQGITGKKCDYTSIPYSRIQAYSIETAGMLDLDAELDITVSGLGTVRFELNSTAGIKEIGLKISEQVLN